MTAIGYIIIAFGLLIQAMILRAAVLHWRTNRRKASCVEPLSLTTGGSHSSHLLAIGRAGETSHSVARPCGLVPAGVRFAEPRVSKGQDGTALAGGGVEMQTRKCGGGVSRAGGAAEMRAARDYWGGGPNQDASQPAKAVIAIPVHQNDASSANSGVQRVGESAIISSRSSALPASHNFPTASGGAPQ